MPGDALSTNSTMRCTGLALPPLLLLLPLPHAALPLP